MVKRWLGIFLLLSMAAGVVVVKRYLAYDVAESETEISSDVTIAVEDDKPQVVYGMILEGQHQIIEDKVKRNETLGDILEQYNVPAKLINQLSTISRSIFDPRKIAAD